jgi:hypothetical protein
MQKEKKQVVVYTKKNKSSTTMSNRFGKSSSQINK